MDPVLKERGRLGRIHKTRPIKAAERQRLQELDMARLAANRAFDEELVRLYIEGVSSTSIADSINCTVQNVSLMIKRRRKWLGEKRIPYRRTGMI